ncbi:MAG TPA: hypothetical protein ENI85_13740 [Deltaproteobacteria bacterium]|nr:hypothetical protein [Deltaproteobacteria bacterium]
MAAEDRQDEDLTRELLGLLREDRPEPPSSLPDRTIRKVQAELTARDLIDLTTFVFLVRFCAPLLDLVAAFFGHDPGAVYDRPSHDRRPDDE